MESWTAEKGRFHSLGVGQGINNRRKKQHVTKYYTKLRIWRALVNTAVKLRLQRGRVISRLSEKLSAF